MANEKKNEEIKEEINELAAEVGELQVDTDTGEVLDGYDPFAVRRGDAAAVNYTVQEDRVVYKTPYMVNRIGGATDPQTGRTYYNYALGYMLKVNGKQIPQTVALVPTERRGDIYDLLDALFNGSDSAPLSIMRTARTQTVNNRSKTTYSYSVRIQIEDEDGIEIHCDMSPDGNGARMKLDNFYARLKAKGIIK